MSNPVEQLEPDVQPGASFDDRYWVERDIGYGAYCAVYEAFDEEARRTVALKVIPTTEDGTSETAAGRFERELKVIANLQHPGIVELLHFGRSEGGIRYMALEYVEGKTLEERVAEGALPLDEALGVARQVAAALATAHDAGVIHRDLKPANIMLTHRTAGLRVKVLDFGMAKLLARIGDESVDDLTREGMAVGTPRYIAPEQAKGSRKVGPWTDIYALGLVLYEMLVGRKAVEHDSIESAVAEHVNEGAHRLEGLEEHPEPVVRLVRSMVEKNYEKRPANAVEVVEAIDTLADSPLVDLDGIGMDRIFGPPLGVDEDDEADAADAASARAGAVRDDGIEGARPQPAEPPPMPSAEGGPVEDGGVDGEDTQEDIPQGERREPTEDEADAEDLELDWDRYEDYADRREDPAIHGARAPLTADRGKQGPGFGFYLQAVMLPFVVVACFMFITARIPDWSVVARVGFGLAPFVAGISFGAVQSISDRRAGMIPSAVAFCLLAIIVVHLTGLDTLATELWERPAWFLAPLEDVPAVAEVADGLRWAGRQYAGFLADLFGADVSAAPME